MARERELFTGHKCCNFFNPNGDLRSHKWIHITEKLTATKIVGNDAQEREALTVPKLYILKKRLTHVIYEVN